jgi:hypothetical protein
MESILNLGNQCKSDNAFTKKAMDVRLNTRTEQ